MTTFLIHVCGEYVEERDFNSMEECLRYCEGAYIGDIQVYALVAEYTVPDEVPREWTYH